MSHAWRIHELWAEVYCVNAKSLPYNYYERIANSKVPDKHGLREWAEKHQLTRWGMH